MQGQAAPSTKSAQFSPAKFSPAQFSPAKRMHGSTLITLQASSAAEDDIMQVDAGIGEEAGGAPRHRVGSGSSSSLQHLMAQRAQQQQQQMGGLLVLLGPDGALGATSGASMVLSMEHTSNYVVRCAHLKALLATRSAVLYRFVGSRLLDALDGWLQVRMQAASLV